MLQSFEALEVRSLALSGPGCQLSKEKDMNGEYEDCLGAGDSLSYCGNV